MIVEDCVQGSAAWHKARLGIPTASQFSRIFTAGGKVSTQAEAYMHTLLAEYFLGEPSGGESQAFMDRGTRLEPAARSWYSYERNAEVRQVGICLSDDRMIGASPDALVGDDGILEIKCPSAAAHIGYLLDGKDIAKAYRPQVQGLLYVTDRAWVDLVTYSPASHNLTSRIVRVGREEGYIEELHAALSSFVLVLLAMRLRLQDLGCTPATQLKLVAGQASEDPF